MSAARVVLICEECGGPIESSSPPNTKACEQCRPERIRRLNRERCARWYESNRGRQIESVASRRNPDPTGWDAPAPIYSRSHLPGGWCELSSKPRWRLQHQHLVPLHGLLTAITGDHNPSVPRFCLIPDRSDLGCSVYLAEDELAAEFARREHHGYLSGAAITLSSGVLVRIKAPVAPLSGRYRVRIDASTPVHVRGRVGAAHTRPSTGNLHSTLTSWTTRRLGLEHVGSKLVLVSSDTHPVRVSMSRKLDSVSGWMGHVVIDVNAPALWLLRVSERIGFGGRCSFGFGRIRVTEC